MIYGCGMIPSWRLIRINLRFGFRECFCLPNLFDLILLCLFLCLYVFVLLAGFGFRLRLVVDLVSLEIVLVCFEKLGSSCGFDLCLVFCLVIVCFLLLSLIIRCFFICVKALLLFLLCNLDFDFVKILLGLNSLVKD